MDGSYLAHRLYLDTSVLQTLNQNGGAVWENEEIEPGAAIRKLRTWREDVDALRGIFWVAERGAFQFIVSDAAMMEVSRKADHRFSQWVADVQDHSHVCLSEEPPTTDGTSRAHLLDGSPFNFLGKGDRALLREAVALECDTFLTMEQRLPRNARPLWCKLRIWVARPPEFWAYLSRFPV